MDHLSQRTTNGSSRFVIRCFKLIRLRAAFNSCSAKCFCEEFLHIASQLKVVPLYICFRKYNGLCLKSAQYFSDCDKICHVAIWSEPIHMSSYDLPCYIQVNQGRHTPITFGVITISFLASTLLIVACSLGSMSE
jgi:hypothetical protein